MKKLWLLIALTLFSISGYAKESLDEIVAVVNDDVVTQSELNRSLSITKMQIAQQHANMPANNVLQKQVLDQLINKKLQLQIAKQVGLNISDTDIDRIIENIASRNNLSTSDLYKQIGREGMSSEEYRSQLREQMTVQKLQQQEVSTRVTVTPDEITHFMKSSLWQDNTNKEYHLDDIVVSLEDAPSSDDIAAAKKQAQSIMSKINQGQTPSDVSSTDLGWRKLPEIPSAFAQHVTAMKVNEVAGPIQTPNGFHIIRLVAARSADGKADAPNRTQVEQLLMQRKFEEQAQNWVSKMRSQAFVTIKMKT